MKTADGVAVGTHAESREADSRDKDIYRIKRPIRSGAVSGNQDPKNPYLAEVLDAVA